MKKILLSIVMLVLIVSIDSAQETMPLMRDSALQKTTQNVAKRSKVKKCVHPIKVEPTKVKHTNRVVPGNNNEQERENEEIEKIREDKYKQKIKDTTIYKGTDDHSSNGSRSVTPVIGRHFDVQPQIDGTPPDNSIAISNGGYVVSATNQGMYFYDTNGGQLNNFTYDNFFSSVTSLNEFCDPRIIYDAQADKFIFFIQDGSTNATSTIFVAFSTTNNPMGNWWIYPFTDHQSTGYWFDFPSVGISTADYFVSGNLFDNSGAFQDNIVYQMNKSNGYAGQTINYLYWLSVSEGISKAFTVVPCSYGQAGSYGPGIYLVATESHPIIGSANEIYVWTISNSVGNSPTMSRTNISVASFSSAQMATQLNGVYPLNNALAGTRMGSAFYLGGYIHYAFCKDAGGGYSGIDYGRIDVANGTLATNAIISGTNTDYAYPSIASYGTSVSDKSIILNFFKSDGTIYPEIRYKWFDDAMNTIASSTVKAGVSYINYTNTPPHTDERWGDYTGIQRRYNTTTTPVCWLAGSYGGSNNMWQGYVAEIKDPNCLEPTTNFSGTPTTGCAPVTTNFVDLSNNSPYSRNWTFTGGTPSNSTAQTPSVSFSGTGGHAVTLTTENACGSNTKTVNGYINVSNPISVTLSVAGATTFCAGGSVVISAPNGYNTYTWSNGVTGNTGITVSSSGSYKVTVTNGSGCSGISNAINVVVNANPTPTISANGSTTICQGQSVTLSTQSGFSSYNWTNGISTGSSANVSTSGNYSVTVVNNNCTGSSNVIAVTIDQYPNPSFTNAVNGYTVTFTNSGIQSNTTYLWDYGDFTGSSVSSPSPHTYTNAGTYTVKLKATNSCGQQETTQVVTVPSTTGIDEAEKKSLKVFPNPTNKILYVDVELTESTELFIYNVAGQIVLKQDIVKRNKPIAVDIESLARGVYWVKIGKAEAKFVKE